MKGKSMIRTYMAKYKWSYALGILTLFLVDLLNLYIPQFTGSVTDGLESGTLTKDGLIRLILEIILVGGLIALGRFFWRFFIFGSARKIERDIRNDLFGHLETLSTNFFQQNKTGDLMSYFTNDLNAVRMAVGPAVIATFDAVMQTVLVLTKMCIYVNPKLTVIAVIPLLFIFAGGLYYGRAIELKFTRKQQAFSDLTDQVQENISGIRVVKAFVQEQKEIESFAKANKENKEKNLDLVKLQAIVMPLLDVVVGISIVITLLYGGSLVIAGKITIGRFVAFNQYIGMLVWPMIAAGDSITYISQGLASAKRIERVFHENAEITDEDSDPSILSLGGEVELNHLTFQYPGANKEVLNDISVKIEPGQTIAILGRTGSGKTTIANLLVRLYDVDKEMIRMDGRSIRDIPLKVLRENVAYVCQDNFLFSDTLANNIAFGSKNADREEIENAAKEACIHDNIMEFPSGYDTLVGERGVTISGGQKQRSSIARALMKDAPILILDDALSAVDTNTEEQLLKHLKENRKGKTTMIIAHRISTISGADHILVLDEGKAAEYGTHETLLASGGIYAQMYEQQQLEKQLEEE